MKDLRGGVSSGVNLWPGLRVVMAPKIDRMTSGEREDKALVMISRRRSCGVSPGLRSIGMTTAGLGATVCTLPEGQNWNPMFIDATIVGTGRTTGFWCIGH